MDSNTTQEQAQQNLQEMLDSSEQFFTYGIIFYPAYIVALSIATSLISLNQKKFRKRWKIDNVFFFIALYLINFFITWTFFNSINKVFRIALPIGLMFYIQYLFNKFQIIGLTGGIAMGKSQVTKYFQQYVKLPVIDCDQLARKVVEPGQPAYYKILNHFGKQILLPDSDKIDRKMLGQIIFSNQSKRKWLTRTTGWYIFIEILREIWKNVKQNNSLIVLDAPLLFESKYLEYMCYPICCVYITDEDVQVKRLMERDNISDEEAIKKIKSQMPIQKKMAKSDILVCNDGTPEQLIKSLNKQIFEFIM